MPFCILEAVEVVLEVVALCAVLFVGGAGGAGSDELCATLYAGGRGVYALFMELLEVSVVLEMMCRVRCMLEVVEGGLCLLEVL